MPNLEDEIKQMLSRLYGREIEVAHGFMAAMIDKRQGRMSPEVEQEFSAILDRAQVAREAQLEDTSELLEAIKSFLTRRGYVKHLS